jgi:hypothetical protein
MTCSTSLRESVSAHPCSSSGKALTARSSVRRVRASRKVVREHPYRLLEPENGIDPSALLRTLLPDVAPRRRIWVRDEGKHTAEPLQSDVPCDPCSN